MLQNYLTVALRNLMKSKLISLINISGLAVSMTMCILAILFVSYQKSWDTWHAKSDRIYRMTSDYKFPTSTESQLYATTPLSLAKLLRETHASIEMTTRVHKFSKFAEQGGEQVAVSGLYAEPSFFDVFDFSLTEGDASHALAEPYSILLSQSQAVALFGEPNAMGKTVMIGRTPHKVTGMLADPPGLTYLQFQSLISFSTLDVSSITPGDPQDLRQGLNNTHTFLVLQEGSDPSELETYLPQMIRDHYPPQPDSWIEGLYIQALSDINLGTNMVNDLRGTLPGAVVPILAILSIIVVSAACLNSTSLTIARGISRTNEMGLRKVVGASRTHIAGQVLFESIFTAFLAFCVAAFLLLWLFPAFNSLSVISLLSIDIGSSVLKDPGIYLTLLGFSLAVGILSGSYPAFYLSRFIPILLLRGKCFTKGHRRWTFKHALVMGQFGLSLFFVLSSLFAYRQFNYLMTSNYGFDHENILNIRLKGVSYDVFKQVMSQSPAVERISAVSQPLMAGQRAEIGVKVPGKRRQKASILYIDPDFIPNVKVMVFAGRNFGRLSDINRAVLLNRTAARHLGLGAGEEAIGKMITLGDHKEFEVVGIVEDFQTYSMGAAIDPIILRWEPDRLGEANVRAIPGQMSEVIDHLERTWPTFGRGPKAEYVLFTTQIREGFVGRVFADGVHIVMLMAVFAVIIALLGILGMAVHTVEIRVHEIGIRKVLGASTWQLTTFLSKSFVIMAVVGALPSATFAWYINHLWLEQFALRIPMNPWLFGVTVAGMLGLVLTVVGSQTYNAATANPVKTLRSE